jgi:hypothetical protein
VRVRSGCADNDGLVLRTANADECFSWDDVELMCLGIICQLKNGKTPESQIRKAVRGLFFGEEDSKEPEEYAVISLLDIYLREHQAPFRIDKDSINYKSFLSNPGYTSASNFKPLVKKIAYFAGSARFNSSLVAFLTDEKDRIHKYASIYDFQEDSRKKRENLINLIPRIEIDLQLDEDDVCDDFGREYEE